MSGPDDWLCGLQGRSPTSPCGLIMCSRVSFQLHVFVSLWLNLKIMFTFKLYRRYFVMVKTNFKYVNSSLSTKKEKWFV